MTRYVKLAISLPSRAAENVRRAVKRGEAASVSAYIAAAVEAKVHRETMDEYLESTLAETGGPPTPEEIRWADRMLGPRRRTTRPKRRRR